MIANDLNLNNLRVFESVYRARSMTVAARELHLTQSGVSQHMLALEQVLGVKLFDRIKQRLVPTAAGSTLYAHCSQTFSGLEAVLSEIRGGEKELTGTVPVGMPIEFGNNLLMPALSSFCQKHSKVKFALRLGFATEMYEGILKGELDFAFVDAFAHDRRITTAKVYDEVLYLCAAPALFKRLDCGTREDEKLFSTLEYVDYQPDAPVVHMWFEHHFKKRQPRLNLRANVMDVQAVSVLIREGLAAGVLPGHLVTKLEKEGVKLHKFKGCGKPLKNEISVAYLQERSQSPTASAALKWLLSSLKTRV